MPCYSPLEAWRGPVGPSGKRSIVFKRPGGVFGSGIELPCGQCIGCRLERTRQWAIRCSNEASLYEDNCFLTLTYSDENIPKNGSLVPRHFTLFMKKLRFRFGEGIRFFHCGEYGEQLGRPHYHACLFNFDFEDKVFAKMSGEHRVYTSETLDRTWGHGHCWIGTVTEESAAYVARYAMKKVTGDKAQEHYGERVPEYATMSRRPGIGSLWYERFKKDCYPSDYLVTNGNKAKVPKFYDSRLEKEDPGLLKELKEKRVELAEQRSKGEDLFRLRDREIVKRASLNRLYRPLEVSDDNEGILGI